MTPHVMDTFISAKPDEPQLGRQDLVFQGRPTIYCNDHQVNRTKVTNLSNAISSQPDTNQQTQQGNETRLGDKKYKL